MQRFMFSTIAKTNNESNATLQFSTEHKTNEEKPCQPFVLGVFLLLPEGQEIPNVRFSTIARRMVATLQKSEGGLWHTQGAHFDCMGRIGEA